ncbi:MAG: FAD-binding oxidoreductase [Pseudomonadota bacterium]
MKVTRLPKDPGPAAWNDILPTAPMPQALDEDITADWLVIGAGYAGLSATRRLAQLHPEARIVLLEARRIGEGPAGRNSGFMIDLPHDLSSSDYGGEWDQDRTQIALNRAGIDFAADMAAEFDLSEEAFSRTGKINAAATAKGTQHNRDYAAHLTSLGEGSEFLDAAQMREVTGSSYYQSGLYTPGTAMIQPALYVRGVASGLRSNRVSIFENTPVMALARNGAWQAQTPGGTVTAAKVILAVNGHANSFGHYRGRLLHVFTYASMTRALSAEEVKRLGGHARWGATSADPMGTTVRRISGTGGDRIVVRNRFTCDPSMDVPDRRLRAVARDHDAAFQRRFPMLSDVGMEYRWGGRLCLSRNGVAAFGEVDEGLYSACCQNGLGTAKGTTLGLAAAELASGEPSWIVDHLLAQDAPQKLPPAPIAALGANAVMRWGEWRAGLEK